MPRIVAISDTHGFHEYYPIPDGDIFIHAGDWCSFGKLEEAVKFAVWVNGLSFKEKVIISGNHDVCSQKAFNVVKQLFDEKIHYLCDDACEIDGLSFYGSPWTPLCGIWAWMAEERRLKVIRQRIPFGTDVLITHGPPYGVLDKTHYGDVIGCRHLLERVKVVQPKVHIFGHVHEQGGRQGGLGETRFFNVAVNDRNTAATVIDI